MLEFKLISSGTSHSLIRAKIITGRTHQIRVHSSHKGYPILGDIKYGDAVYNKKLQSKGLKRMLLHAESINFKNLDKNYLEVPESQGGMEASGQIPMANTEAHLLGFCFFNSKTNEKFEIDNNEDEISIGKAKIMMEGNDISIISYSRGLETALEVEKTLSQKI